jgi:hypothetical protein
MENAQKNASAAPVVEALSEIQLLAVQWVSAIVLLMIAVTLIYQPVVDVSNSWPEISTCTQSVKSL